MKAQPQYRTTLEWLKARLGGRKSPSQPERRSNQRQRIRFDAEFRKLDISFPVVGVDIHEDGAKVLAKQAWETGTVVFLSLKEVQLAGFAEVRHCSLRKDGRYAIGLLFQGPLVPQGAEWQIQRVHQKDSAWTQTDDKAPADKPRVA